LRKGVAGRMLPPMDRRQVLGALVSAPVVAACKSEAPAVRAEVAAGEVAGPDDLDLVRSVEPLGVQWKTYDPFLFCAHHDDAYPAGNAQLGPNAPLEGRRLGQDFELRDGYRMYHGRVVPGFPSHPHRGFETVTIVRRGLVDHSDSLGAAARYGQGDVQWLTAGQGIVHAEMFPLLDRSGPNPLELFQVWLNLPKADKFAEPHFSMFWRDKIPRFTERDGSGKATDVTVIAGRFGSVTPLPPPPHSWASRPESDLAIWTLRLDPEACFTLPAASEGVNRTLYVFKGRSLRIGPREVPGKHAARIRADRKVLLENGPEETEVLVLQGRPIGEPVVQRGPFVMNSASEIQQAYSDYRRTQFGGWPWPSHDPVHGDTPERFARHADGRVERAT
jgi:redox-sensitive bicupin YhaK (pirin superfamily)